MFKNIFKKKSNEDSLDKNILVTALLIHAAKIDDNYTDKEKKIIKKAVMDLNQIKLEEAEKILINAEKKEQEGIEKKGEENHVENGTNYLNYIIGK